MSDRITGKDNQWQRDCTVGAPAAGVSDAVKYSPPPDPGPAGGLALVLLCRAVGR